MKTNNETLMLMVMVMVRPLAAGLPAGGSLLGWQAYKVRVINIIGPQAAAPG